MGPPRERTVMVLGVSIQEQNVPNRYPTSLTRLDQRAERLSLTATGTRDMLSPPVVGIALR